MPYKRKYKKIGESIVYKGRTLTLKAPKDLELNGLQQAHVAGTLNVYEPIEAYSEKWETITKKVGYWEDYVSARPIPDTRKRNDLPPISSQWRESYKNGV